MVAHEWSNTNYYDVLGIPADASIAEITRAFRQRARESHPDAHPDDPDASARFIVITKAYEVLGDESSRREYDMCRSFGLNALDLEDALTSGFRGYIYAPSTPQREPEPVTRSRRRWIAVAAAAALFGGVLLSTNGSDREDAGLPSSVSTTIAPLVTEPPDAPEGFAYDFSDIDCSVGGWSGIFTNADRVTFFGELSAVALKGDEVVARAVARPASPVPAGGQQQVQFAWDGAVPPPGSRCQIESVTQG